MIDATNNMQNVMPVIDHAANMSDRWLFIAALIVCGLIIYAVGKIALSQIKVLLSDLKEERKSRETFSREVHESMLNLISRLEKIGQRSNDVIENNTQAMKEVAKEVSFCRQQNGRKEPA